MIKRRDINDKNSLEKQFRTFGHYNVLTILSLSMFLLSYSCTHRVLYKSFVLERERKGNKGGARRFGSIATKGKICR